MKYDYDEYDDEDYGLDKEDDELYDDGYRFDREHHMLPTPALAPRST